MEEEYTKKNQLNKIRFFGSHLIFFLLSICFVGFFLSKSVLQEFPAYMHGWSQSDRYALAEGFVENGGNLIFPQTRNLKPNHVGEIENPRGITAVDFPLTEYLSSWVMRIFGSNDPVFFRLIQIFLGLAGIYSLFRMSYSAIGSVLWIFPVLIVFTSPAYFYYLIGFIPTIPGLSFFLIGCWMFLEKKKETKGLILATIGAMIRTPLLIPLLVIMIVGFEKTMNPKRYIRNIVISLGLFLSWFIWSKYLNLEFGSIFLGELMPAGTFWESLDLLYTGMIKWWSHIINKWILLILLLPLLYFFIPADYKRVRINIYLRIGLMVFVGALFYSVMMAQQFEHHDYYFLDAFLIPLIFIVLGFFRIIKDRTTEKTWKDYISWGVILVVLPFCFQEFNQKLKERRNTGPWDRFATTLKNYRGADKLLDSLGISQSEPVLIIDSYSTNAPLLLSKRFGYTVQNTTPDELDKALKYPVRYAIIQHDFLRQDILMNAPEYLNKFIRIGGNNYVSVFFRKNGTRQSEEQFAGIDKLKLLFSGIDSSWSDLTFNPDSSITLKNKEFGPTFRKSFPGKDALAVWFNAEIHTDVPDSGIQLVFKRKCKEGIEEKIFSLSDYGSDHTNFKARVFFPFDSVPSEGILEVFLYNPQRVEVRISKPDLHIYRF